MTGDQPATHLPDHDAGSSTDVPLVRDTAWFRLDPTTLLAGSPMRMFRVTAAGSRVLDAIETGQQLPPGHRALTDRLRDAGAVHPEPPASVAIDDVTLVVPTFGEDGGAIERLLAALPNVPAIVVDDASPTPVAVSAASARVVRLARNGGPAAARNAGITLVETPFVLFVDADAVLDEPALGILRAHLDDPRVGAVAPRVASPGGANGALGRYDAVRSPLDMGASPASVRAGSRVGYVPAAALLCRTSALREVGGFAEDLRYGEDVDLAWRLATAGWTVRYEPRAIARHAVRPTLTAWLRQRFHYGKSAARLARRHPGALAPVRLSRWGAATWATGLVIHPAGAVGVAAAGAVPLARKLAPDGGRPRWLAACRLTALGNYHAARQLADATTGVWWPIAVASGLVSRRARRLLLAAATVPAVAEWARRRPNLDPVRFGLLRLLDRGAYGLGVWRGVIAERETGPLLPGIDERAAVTRRGIPEGAHQ